VKELEAKNLQELGFTLHNRKDTVFYRANWLLYILLNKAKDHKNTSVTRYFIKSFLKLSINIEEVQDFVYNDLIQILNIGMFYRDAADLQADSRFFKVISSFFNAYYQKLSPQLLKSHIKKFLQAIKTHAKFLNTVIGLILVLQDLNTKDQIIDKDDLKVLICIIREHVGGFNLRKQHQTFQVVLNLLLFNTNNSQVRDIFLAYFWYFS